MAGFLDAKERVIDLILTDTGKQLLFKGALNFSYWVPFDDEVDYQPAVSIFDSGSLDKESLALAVSERQRMLIEDPLVREACSGYRGLNTTQEDYTNLNHPLYTVAPGVGHMSPLPQISVSNTGVLDIQVLQTHIMKKRDRHNLAGEIVTSSLSDVGYQRDGSTSAYVDIGYSTGSFTSDHLEGFLITVYHLVSGSYIEVLHNRTIDGDVAYRNDLKIVQSIPDNGIPVATGEK